MPAPPKAYLSWSSGKDSAYSLIEARRLGLADVVGILTTVNAVYDRVAMHSTRVSLLDRQAEALGLPCLKIDLPSPCTNAEYEARMARAVDAIKAQGVRHVVFGDLYLRDIREYRERQMAAAEMTPIFPLWDRPTRALAGDMLAAGIRAHLTCVDPRQIDRRFAGRLWDEELITELPASADPCGENGEFHTAVTAGPMYSAPINVEVGEVVERDGFVFADVIPRRGYRPVPVAGEPVSKLIQRERR